MTLTKECRALIQNKLPPKLKDISSFSIPCMINDNNFYKVFCDFGASVNFITFFMCKKMGVVELKLTTMVLQLDDHFVRYPLGILEDVMVKVGNFVVTTNFVVLNMDENPLLF